MKNWKRITLAVFVLIGGTLAFGYWSFNQFNNALDSLSASSVSNTHSVYTSFKQNTGLASTSPEISGAFTDSGLASTSPEISLTLATSTEPNLSFTFPQKDTKVYIGCTYQISWQSSIIITSLEADLIDAGARRSVGPIGEGSLAKENLTENDSQNLNWKVGVVWPGAYYINVSKINDVEAEFRSKSFKINKMPTNISTSEKENVCKESGGSLVAS